MGGAALPRSQAFRRRHRDSSSCCTPCTPLSFRSTTLAIVASTAILNVHASAFASSSVSPTFAFPLTKRSPPTRIRTATTRIRTRNCGISRSLPFNGGVGRLHATAPSTDPGTTSSSATTATTTAAAAAAPLDPPRHAADEATAKSDGDDQSPPSDDSDKSGDNLSVSSVALLNAVAVIWGTQHAIVKTVLDDPNCDPSSFSLARFGLAAIIAAPFVPSVGPAVRQLLTGKEEDGGLGGSPELKSTSSLPEDAAMNGQQGGGLVVNAGEEDGITDRDADDSGGLDSDSIAAWRWGAEMGAWMFLGYAFQSVGLLYTTAQRSGFLLYLNVKFVPFFARILLGREISIPTWASALTALVGTALLSYDGTSAALNVGDLWSITAAAASAMFILRLEAASSAVKDSSALNAACLVVVTLMSAVWAVGDGAVASVASSVDASSSAAAAVDVAAAFQTTVDNVVYTVRAHPLALIYLGGVTTALANYIQTKAQKDISAERASIIYAMDPVYGAIFANLLLGEQLNGYGLVGAGLIAVAAATNAFLDLGTKKTDEDSLSSQPE